MQRLCAVRGLQSLEQPVGQSSAIRNCNQNVSQSRKMPFLASPCLVCSVRLFRSAVSRRVFLELGLYVLLAHYL
jgi:hypothetical protein